MKTTETKWQWWLAVLMATLAVTTVRADNPCTEHTITNQLTCLNQGTLVANYVLAPTNINACVGQPITQPTVSKLAMTNGQEKYYVNYNCPAPHGNWQTSSIPYTFGSLYFIPSLPQIIWTPGTSTYTAYVIATGSPCGPVTNVLGTVTVTVTIPSFFATNNLILWLKADAITGLTNNAPIGTWFDSSGWHNDASQPTVTNKPLWVAGALNSLPVVWFNATNLQTFSSLPRFLNGATQAEEFIVLKVANAKPTAQRALWHIGTGNYLLIAYPNTNGDIVDDFGSQVTHTINCSALPLDQYHIVEMAGQNGFWAAWINGLLQTNTSINSYAFSASSQALGNCWTNYFDGDLAEILVFSRPLTTAERLTVNTYLGGKYALRMSVPPTPSNLLVTAISPSQIHLNWNELLNQGTVQVSIERKAGVGGTYAEIARTVDAPFYTDTNLSAGTTYYYRLRAVNVRTFSPYSNETNATTLAEGDNLPLSDLRLWLKADAGIIGGVTNGTVGQWLDQSGNGFNATAPAPINQPALVPGAIANFPVIRFDATNSYFQLQNYMNGATGVEAFVVLKVAADPPPSARALWFNSQSYSCWNKYPDTDGSISENFGSSATHSLGVPAQPLTQYHLYEVASQASYWAAWINGVLLYQTTNNTIGFDNSPTLGWSCHSGFGGDIAEVLVFDRALTTGERATAYAYLDGKYSLTTAPLAPSNVVATAISTNQIGLTWDENWDRIPLYFAVERSMTSNGVYQVVARLMNTDSYVDTNLSAGTTYYYQVQAINFMQWSQTSSVAAATTFSNGASLPFSNLALWLKADAGLVQETTNTPVNLWLDQSGNGNTAMPPAPANQPIWMPGVIGDRPVVRFNGTNQYLNMSSFMNTATGGEAFVVLKVSDTNTLHSLWEMGGVNHNYNYDKQAYPDTDGNINDDFGGVTIEHIGIPSQPLTQYHVYEVSSQPNNWAAWINGVLQYQTSTNSVGFSHPPALGNSTYDNGYGITSSYFAGDIAEVLVFNRALDDDERIVVNNYLKRKYNAGTPVISIIAPTNNTVFQPPAKGVVVASVNDYNDSVEQIQFFDGTNTLMTYTTTNSDANYFLIWSNAQPGTHSLTVRATDGLGLTSSATVNVILDVPPSVTITNPANDASFPAGTNITLAATASDADGSVVQVQFFQGTASLGIVTNPPYNLLWSNVSAGTYALTAQATDNNGIISTSAVVNVTADIPPSVVLTVPTNGAVFSVGSNIQLGANVSDDDGTITHVQFFQGTASLGIVTNPPYNLVWSNVSAGVYALTAQATDNSGLMATSAVVNVTVESPPTVSITNPTNNAVIIPANTNVVVTATANDSDGSIVKVQFFQGSISLGIVANAPYSLTWSNVNAGTYALTAQATDNSGLTTTSTVVSITVAGVSIASPTNNLVLTAPATIYLSATVIDNVGVTQVQYFSGTTNIGTATTTPYNVTWSNVSTNAYTLTARATDTASRLLTSSAVNVIVDANPSTADRDGDGMSDYMEYLGGRNPLVAGAVPDTNGVVNLQIYTPLR